MASRTVGRDLLSQLNILSQVGVVGGLSDGQLLQRFLADRDRASEAAFTALVYRHGPMVMRVCRQVLGDSSDAEDAFQSSFLILASRAASVREADSLASWLHGVARRVAVRARADAARRRVYERRGAAMKPEDIESREARPEEWAELHEEIARLPGRYREPVVLCYFEGLTSEEVAGRLGCAQGTILSRLCRARERLRRQLARRGLMPTVTLSAGAVHPGQASAVLPKGLIDVTVRASFAFVGTRAAGTAMLPTRVVTLARKGIRAMMISKTTSLAALALVCAGAFGWMQILARSSDGDKPGSTTQAASPGPGGPAAPARAPGSAGSSEFPYAVKFEQGATRFLEGDRITILEVRGTSETMARGHIYWIRGTFTLASHDRATLAAYTTARSAAEGTGTPFKAQMTAVGQGSGTFTLFLPMSCDGWPHISFYPTHGGSDFGGNYFGTGDSVLKEWWGSKGAH